ncbi:hypothetical protein PYCCODRAFT_1460419 [Trametes coccinea BRFM310]|uniref:Uncharacterized protein n=1 Tax=Trametes coccinea (strain BRFM310) TaxID=1353009 RepID=A0A1Y2IJ78_TRAC3|nr:hypothetical protein PYCCODRAFT_1460419 [Trametes coccinea BRFM310]
MPSTMPSTPRPAQRRTHRSPAPKRKFTLFTRAPAAPTPAPTVIRRRICTGRHVDPEWVPIPRFTALFPPHEYKLLPLAEAQKREEIVHPSLDIDDVPRAAEDQDGLSRPDRERDSLGSREPEEQEQPLRKNSRTEISHGH